MVPGTEKKSFFLRPFLGSTPLRSSSKSKIRSHKENEIFSLILLQPCTMVVTVSNTRLNTRLLQPCFMVVTTLNYNLVTTLLHPCNKVVITPRAHARARGYVIGRGVYILYIYKKISNFFSIFQNTHFQTPISTQEGFSSDLTASSIP